MTRTNAVGEVAVVLSSSEVAVLVGAASEAEEASEVASEVEWVGAAEPDRTSKI